MVISDPWSDCSRNSHNWLRRPEHQPSGAKFIRVDREVASPIEMMLTILHRFFLPVFLRTRTADPARFTVTAVNMLFTDQRSLGEEFACMHFEAFVIISSAAEQHCSPKTVCLNSDFLLKLFLLFQRRSDTWYTIHNMSKCLSQQENSSRTETICWSQYSPKAPWRTKSSQIEWQHNYTWLTIER